MWSANFVETLSMSHIAGDDHDYENVRVDAHCGRNAYREARCTKCGASEPGSRIEIEGTALNHHYVLFEEDYYTKDENGNFNFGKNHVCTSCKKSYEEDEEEDVLTEADHVGHEYVGVITKWNDDYTEATADLLCTRCYGGDLDCLLGDNTIELAKNVKTTDITKERYHEVVEIEVDEDGNETEVKEYFWLYTANFEYQGETYVGHDMASREEDKYDRNPFTDVPNNEWYAPAVLWAVEEGITTGYPDGTFGPEDFCTRAQAVTFLWRAAGQPVVEDVELTFPDVSEDDWFYDAVCWAVSEGVTTGYPDGTFAPEDYCSRSQIVTFIWRTVDEPEAAITEEEFADVSEEDWFYDAVLWAVGEELTTGYPDGNFGPDDTCTRAQIVTFLYRQFAAEEDRY